MKSLAVGEIVCITAGIPAFWQCTGRIVEILEPFVSTAEMKAKALMEMRLYSVRLNDGRRFRFRGRDLELLPRQIKDDRHGADAVRCRE